MLAMDHMKSLPSEAECPYRAGTKAVHVVNRAVLICTLPVEPNLQGWQHGHSAVGVLVTGYGKVRTCDEANDFVATNSTTWAA